MASSASAYWEYGHQTIGAIAWRNVRPQTRVAISRLLAQSKLLGTPECPAATIEQAAVWPDCIKPLKDADGKRRFDYAYGWHFQDVNLCQPFTLTEACKDGNCVSAQIERDVKLLQDRHAPRKDRVQALAFLVHFVGDLHQPLHAGEKGDKGGNDVKAVYGTYTSPRLNLHSIWDGYLAERAITTGPSLVRRYPAAERRKISAMKGDPCAPTPAPVTIDEATIQSLVPTVRLDVKRGGLRLAKLLDKAFA